MLPILFLILAVKVVAVPTDDNIFDTSFLTYPNMVCQLINGYRNNHPGLFSISFYDYVANAHGTNFMVPNPRQLTRLDTTTVQGAIQSEANRHESCGDDYCYNLFSNIATNAGQAGRERYPLRGQPQMAPSFYGNGWDLLSGRFPGGLIGRLDCDEYPYASTLEGGNAGGNPTIINCIDGSENRSHGSVLGHWYRARVNGNVRIPHLGEFYMAVSNVPESFIQPNGDVICPVTCWETAMARPIVSPNIWYPTQSISCIS